MYQSVTYLLKMDFAIYFLKHIFLKLLTHSMQF